MDARDFEAEYGVHPIEIDEHQMTVTFEVIDDDGEEIEVNFPFKFEVCNLCNGKGTHVNPSVDAHGLTHEDFAEDPDFAESYFSGHYDVPCNRCNGNRVEPVIDEENSNKEELELYHRLLRAKADMAREEAYERRMGF